MIYKTRRFAIIGGDAKGTANMILDEKTGKYIRNPELFGNQQTAQQMSDTIKQKTQESVVQAEKQAAARQARMEVGHNNQNFIKDITTKSRNEGFKAGQNSIGLKQGALNTWNRMGTLGKVGTVAAGTAVAGLALKGLFGGNNKKE